MNLVNRVKSEEVLRGVQEEGNILHTVKQRKSKWTIHICHLQHIIEEKIEGTGRRGRRRKWLLSDLKATKRYWKLKQETLYHTVWRSLFRTDYAALVRQTA